MKFFVTGVGGQLGHDVMNELLKRGHEGVGSDIQENYSGVADGSAVTKAPYVALDITDKNAVEKVITEVKPDAVIHCAAFSMISVREKQGAEIVEKLTGKKAEVCCDPTVLTDRKRWDELSGACPFVSEKYIFCYFIGNNPSQREFAKKLAQQLLSLFLALKSCFRLLELTGYIIFMKIFCLLLLERFVFRLYL